MPIPAPPKIVEFSRTAEPTSSRSARKLNNDIQSYVKPHLRIAAYAADTMGLAAGEALAAIANPQNGLWCTNPTADAGR